MIICDVNLLVYATVRTMPHHRVAAKWLSDRLADDVPLALSHPTVFGFIRVTTNRKIFENPRSVDEAVGDIEQWLDAGAVMLTPGPQHLATAFRLLRELGTAGNLTTDVQLAALAIEHQAELHSADVDFRRFKGLRWVNPLEGS